MPPILRRLAAVVVLVIAATPLTTGAAAAAPADEARTSEQRIRTAGADLDTTLYLPATLPAPAVLVAHGFGGSKATVDTDARELAARGFVALAWSARGFGTSTGQIALNAPDAEVADAVALVDWLAARPEVRLDGPGDPRIGVTGGSYGGALSLMLAGYDQRVDALAPVITWNDLGQALFPNAAAAQAPPADTPAHGAFGADGVFKSGWAGVFFSAGLGPADTGQDPAGADAPGTGAALPSAPAAGTAPGGVVPPTGGQPANCGRFTAEVCAAYTEAATTGRLSAATADLLGRSSPATVTDRITAPALIVQGEADTLFGLDQADANARQIAAAGGPVKVIWYSGGHDGTAPGEPLREEIGEWFDFHLAGRGDDPGTGFGYTVVSGVRGGSNTPTTRSLLAPEYPGLPGRGQLQARSLPLDGAPQLVVRPAGGNPAAITALPGLGGALGAIGGRVTAFTAELPGQSAQFRTAPFEASTLVTGAPRVQVTVARLPGQPAPADAVLFAKVYEVAPGGLRTLLGSAVAPFRVAVPADGSPVTSTVTLPGVVAPIEAGNSLMVSVSTTDQGYAGGVEPAVWRVGTGPDAALTVPEVPGENVTASTVPSGPLIGIGVVLALALLAWVVGRVLGRRRDRAAAPADPADADVPLRIRDLAKTYRGGFSAVKGVSFDVERGMVLGLLGPNGAGKTTVLRMLMGLITPTAGSISAFGERVGPGSPVLARIGAFVEGPGFLPHLSGAENLRLYWAATGRPEAEAHLGEALEIAGLGDSVHRRVGTYSQGMRQRLAIAQAMLGLPELLVLDEPTNGLDPPQIHAMRELLRRYAQGGRTVLVSSHLLAEVEQTCTHVVVMHKGRVVADGTVDEIMAGGGAATFGVDAPDRAAAVLGALDGVLSVEVGTGPGTVHAELNGTPRSSAVRALVTAGVDVTSAGPRRRLEDAFLQLVGEDTTP
ncbi:alpha/beta fold hydrolase [Pseudonocardia humida]|uniref:Alpha/beta fold hydrolase n=1 Tax=Pseudonocardia humida TaxID=2800819 RepID=A0ABT1A4U5_9PSEU|nr:alpha/beta fold hydrolase [Pseudonocardia humida]MCO1657799.1 alpha/beta fold hydrolase [Pseudonocardia humida]